MPIEYKSKNYVEYYIGNGLICCHVDALHAVAPNADLFTKNITEKIIKKIGCAGIISTVSRTIADLNRAPNEKNSAAIQDYRETIKEILLHLEILTDQKHQITKPYLQLSIHGMKDEHYGEYAIEVGTLSGESCSFEVREWFKKHLYNKVNLIESNTVIIFDNFFDGDESIIFHRVGDGIDYLGYGENYHVFQIELSYSLRYDYLDEIVDLLCEMIIEFQKEFAKTDK